MTLTDALAAAQAEPDNPAALAALRARFEEYLWTQFPFLPDAGYVYWLEGRVRDRAQAVECQYQGRCLTGSADPVPDVRGPLGSAPTRAPTTLGAA